MNTWLFQANPKDYDLVEEVSLDLVEDWHLTVHRDKMQKGDRVILWQSGSEGGVYAFGELDEKPYKVKEGFRVDIRYKELLKQPVFKRDLRKHPVLRNVAVLKMPNGKNPFPVRHDEWVALKKLISKDTLNIFMCYGQEENRFTNGLISLLELSRHIDTTFVKSFLRTLLDIELTEEIRTFRVLRAIDGTADAELWGTDCCIRIETKIVSGTLREDQVSDHLDRLLRSTESLKTLVLLTPDDGESDYITRFLSSKSIKTFCRKGQRHKVLHLEWRCVDNFLREYVTKHHEPVFNQLVSQFLSQIHDRIFDQDFAGIIQKIAFGDRSEVYADTYLREIKKRHNWNTPRKYEKLDGTGRKLLLYDNTRKAITVEVEVRKVEKTKSDPNFPWTNWFVPNTLLVYRKPIALTHIQTIAGFDGFARGMTAAWNVTQEQYRQLTGRQGLSSKVRC